MADKTVSIRFRGKDDTRSAFNSVQNNLRGLSSQLGNLRGPFAAITGIAAGLGLTKIFGDAVEATRAYEQSTLKLDAVMKATGGTVGFTRQELEKSILAMERDTIFAQNEIRDATSIMATFKSVQGETFTQGIELAADMAAVMDQSLKSSVVQLGKALEDPVRGLSALREVGVSFTAQQEDMIKTLVESGEKMKAQGIILEALEGQFGGTAGKENEGLSGAISSVSEQFDRMLVSMGKAAGMENTMARPLQAIADVLSLIADEADRAHNNMLGEGRLGFGGELQEPIDFGEPHPREQLLDEGIVIGTVEQLNREQMEARRKASVKTAADRDATLEAQRLEKLEELKKAAAKAEKQRAKEARERMAEARYQSRLFADEQVKAVKAAADAAAQAQKQAEEELKGQIAFDKAAREFAAEREREDAARQAAMIQRTMNVLAGLNTEREALDIHTKARFEVLQEARAEELISEENYQWQKERLREQHAKRMIAIEDAETKRRYGISEVHRKLDLQSSQFFFGQMAQMMDSGNRKMFEIGKASAIAETVVQTYRAAQGAYASLAGIPFIGPALGIAAAAAAVVAGVARVEAIRSTQFGGGAVAAPTFNANPSTGLPTDFGPGTSLSETAPASTERTEPRIVNITLRGSGMVSTSWIRDELIPSINEAVGDGAKVLVN